jgi:hypothetical protein
MAFVISRVNDSFPKCLCSVRAQAAIQGRRQHFGNFVVLKKNPRREASMQYTYCLVIAIGLFFSPLVASAEQYLCVTEHCTGFAYNEKTKSWKTTNFVKEDKKYIISKGDGKGYKITKVGESVPEYTSEEGFNKSGFLFCRDQFGEFKFNKNSGRFLNAYLVGYFNVSPDGIQKTDESSDNPLISIGRCSPF